jgi:hypothetical protein
MQGTNVPPATATPASSGTPVPTPTPQPTHDGGPGEGAPSDVTISVGDVEVTTTHLAVRGKTTLPDGSCVSSELWADGVLQTWWPTDACAPVRDGRWELVVPLDPEHQLVGGVQYMVRAYQPGGPNVVATFPFDLDAPQTRPTQPPAADPLRLLPESAEPLHQASAELNGDGRPEVIVLTGWGGAPNRLGYDFLQLFVITTNQDGSYDVAWQSEQLPTERGEPLEVRDLNGDALPEVLSMQAMGAAGQCLYILSWQNSGYGWLTPQGGHFDGQTAFGEVGARVEDRNGDGLPEILASYGPVAKYTDIYAWSGQAYVYRETLGGSSASYRRMEVAGAGFSLEVPVGWNQLNAATWTAPDDGSLRLGVNLADLEPPQEPEPAVLPQSSQILESVPVQLPWSSARRITLEVYGDAPEGGGQAPVVSVETHVLAVVEVEDGRRAIDIYAAAPTVEQLTTLNPILERAIKSVSFASSGT